MQKYEAAADDFASTTMNLSCDDNGNLTDDGLFKFVYDAWNRMVAVKSRFTSSTTQTTFATYAYDGANRRASKPQGIRARLLRFPRFRPSAAAGR